MRTQADTVFQGILRLVNDHGEVLETRNHSVKRVSVVHSEFTSFPLITIRKTAWKKALSEMEWFMSGDPECPENLRDWWDGQLSPDGLYSDGYGSQMRTSTMLGFNYELERFDQVKFVLDALKNNPNGRRTLMTTWNPGEMANITEVNCNPKTPTNCHGTVTQFFVSRGRLNVFTYQRSADLLLGFCHNLVQYWALMLYFAHHSGLQPGRLSYSLGDAHVYQDPTHQACVDAVVSHIPELSLQPTSLVYDFSGEHDGSDVPVFKSSDFRVEGIIADPIPGLPRPKLF